MCNLGLTVETALTKTIQQFLEEGRMFTGYDVTIETRTREKIKLHHNEVKAEIHNLVVLTDAVEFGFSANNQTVKWLKTQQSMPNGQWAFVYSPENLDPSGYLPQQPKPMGALQSAPLVSPSITMANDGGMDSGGQQADGTFATDHRNRLLIPTKFLQQIGVKAGDMVDVIVDQQKSAIYLVVDPIITQGSTIFKKGLQKVERDGDLRLSGSTLKCANLFDTAKLMIEVDLQNPAVGILKTVKITAG